MSDSKLELCRDSKLALKGQEFSYLSMYYRLTLVVSLCKSGTLISTDWFKNIFECDLHNQNCLFNNLTEI